MVNLVKKSLRFLKSKRFCRRHEGARILGAEYFFIDEVPIGRPMGSARDLARFARLRVEAISPFALDDVLYGFFKGEKKLTVFVAYKSRVKQLPWRENCHIFPEFLPNMILGRDFGAKFATVSRDGSVNFHGAAENLRLKLSNPTIFNADLMEPRLKTRAKNLEKFSVFLGFGICSCLVALLLLGGFSMFSLFQDRRLNNLKEQIDGRKAEVESIASKHAFLGRMAKFYCRENFCLSSLESVNRVRPDDILFSDVHCDADRGAIKIVGRGQSVSSVKKFCSAIERCTGVISVEASNIRSKDHGTSFTADVCFK